MDLPKSSFESVTKSTGAITSQEEANRENHWVIFNLSHLSQQGDNEHNNRGLGARSACRLIAQKHNL